MANPEEQMVTISKKEYEDLLKTQRFMRALEAAGVDNWEGYDMAIDIADAASDR